ncbi:hypothetical protein Leryth_025408 [Lithospermum erythrorhizon]|nr:hypothetical protein Leryth_025408 [Lithospermum erythrorhizon]
MKYFRGFVCKTSLIIVLLILPTFIHARHLSKNNDHHKHHESIKLEMSKLKTEMTKQMDKKANHPLQIAGSRLPDCSHACGSCTPCRLVMVSYVCSSIEEAETCPMAYKCMCHNKSYPVP